MKKIISAVFLLISLVAFSQKTALIKGVIINSKKQPIQGVAVVYSAKGTVTNSKGAYALKIPIGKTTTVIFSHTSYKKITKKFTPHSVKTFYFSPILEVKNKKLKEVTVKDDKNKAEGITTISPEKAKNLVGANAGVENVLMTLPGVSNNNELSTQYNVRGGNFDENLVYVNGIEIYRPFLIRSGQQEGLSFINSNMVRNIKFSAGGFQAKYGDKLSSVLDITYRKPTQFATQVGLSLLGASATIENTMLDKKLSAILGIRYRNNSLFVNSKDIQTNFHPKFTDIQTFLSYEINSKVTLHFLGNLSLNTYNYTPLSRKTRFGTIANPLELTVYYDGREQDQYKTVFGAFSADYKATKNLKFTGIISAFNTQEQEYFDIVAAYNLGEVDTAGQVKFSRGMGWQLNHARNDLDALIRNVQLKAHLKDGNAQWDASIKYQNENIKDRIDEWEMINALGFSIRPPKYPKNNEPYKPFTAPLQPFKNINATNNITNNRVYGFLQFSKKNLWKTHKIWYNIGVRTQYWSVHTDKQTANNHLIISPRFQFALKPDWKREWLFRISGGWYSQPPFYKELRDANGNIHPKVKAQKSVHLVLGSDYSFMMWKRPFKLTTELYYKHLTDINPYAIDNVRIRYQAKNNAKGYSVGMEMRLNGEFVPGSESWVSIGFLKTQENIDNKGYIDRPNDQRLKFGVLFQDYVPTLPNLKVYLNLIYNTGVLGGSPAYADVYRFQHRLDDYKRADVGISYVFADAKKQYKTGFLHHFKELTAGLELFNMFDIRNAITNTWVRDVSSKRQYGVPNYMTSRVLNIKIGMKF